MQIIVPMAGVGKRFLQRGYNTPKPLIEVEGKPIIQHIVEMFPGENDFVFICNREHLQTTNMEKLLKSIKPSCKIVAVETGAGPVPNVLEAESLISDGPVVVNYCDFSVKWNYEDFKRKMRESGCDGCVTAYKGFHPHLLGPNLYAYMRWDEKTMRILEIQEKGCFTDNKMNEYASTGAYYFKSGALLKKYFKLALDRGLQKNGEFYVSLVYQPMIQDGLNNIIYEVEKFLQWGTPEDFEEYLYWSNAFRAKTHKQEVFDQTIFDNLQIVLPMAGEGKRFRDEGYTAIKPLITVSGKPMFVQAINDLPLAKKTIFLCRREHIEKYGIDKEVKKYFPQSEIIVIEKLTEGQACTCLLAESALDPEKPLLISTVDAGGVWNFNSFCDLFFDEKADAAIWTFRNNVTVERNPQAWGWVSVKADGLTVEKISCKVPVSNNPIRDHAIIGSFYFRKAKFFLDAAKRMIAADKRINNEFYVDIVLNEFPEMGLTARVFEVDKYLGWGTPNDLRVYEYWQDYFDWSSGHPYKKKIDEDFQ